MRLNGGHLQYPLGVHKSTIKPGKKGKWKIDRFTLTESQIGLDNLRNIRDGFPELCVAPGEYTRLVRVKNSHNVVVMSDTRMEALTNKPCISAAKGRVLVHGLGMGFLLENILRKPEVSYVRVIEIDPDLITLVKPHFKVDILADRLEIIEDNALERRPEPNEKYDLVWHDIWDGLSSDNLAQMSTLQRRWARRCETQMCWARHLSLRSKRLYG